MSADSKLLELTMDISDGCKFSCSGCMIERSNPYNSDDVTKLIDMVDDYVGHGYLPFDINIGPTDLLISDNVDEILSDPLIAELIGKFETLIINTTLMSDDKDMLDRLAAYVERVIPGKWLRINAPFDLKKIDNERYVNRIKDNLDYLISKLTTVRFYKLFVVINYDTGVEYTRPDHTIPEDVMKLYDIGLYPDIHIDIVTPHLRNGVDNIMMNQDYYRSFREVVGIMDDIALDPRWTDRWKPILNELNETEGDIRAYTYHRGKLYQHAFVQETMLINSEEFIVEGEWTCSNMESKRLDMLVNQLSSGNYSKECHHCEHVFRCSNRMVLQLKEVIGESRCLSPLGYTEQPVIFNDVQG